MGHFSLFLELIYGAETWVKHCQDRGNGVTHFKSFAVDPPCGLTLSVLAMFGPRTCKNGWLMWLKWKMQINKCYEYIWLNMYECQSHRISNFQAFDQFIPAVWTTSYSLQKLLMPSPPGTNPEGTCTTKRRLWLGCETRWFQWSAELGKCRCKKSWNMTWGTAKWLQTSMLDFL